MVNLYWAPPPDDYFQQNPHHRKEDFPEPDVDLWEENWPVMRLYQTIKSQWRVGSNGPYALDYNVVFYRMDRMNLTAEDHEELFQKLQIVESQALIELRKP